MRFYISDCHFSHKNMLTRMDKRAFPNVEEMDNYMINQWNKKVRKCDDVIILGDFSYATPENTNDILQRLNGNKYLIRGNHDRYINDRRFDNTLFGWVKDYAEMQDNKRKVILCHYPVFCYNGQYRKLKDSSPATYMLFGHVHNSHDQKIMDSFIKQTRETFVYPAHRTEKEQIPCNMINCFCMYSDYMPLTLDEWIEVDKKRKKEV